MNLKVLIADDEEKLAEAVSDMLESENYEVDIVTNGKEALEKAKENVYNCIILDVMMPGLSGIEVVEELRRLNIKTPIILLTAKTLTDDKVEGLDAGANDYITKPFQRKELLARIRSVTRMERDRRKKYIFGDLIFSKESSKISKDKISINLSKPECEILEFFIKNPEIKISKTELKQRIWKNADLPDSIVPMHIMYLQEKFNILGSNVKIDVADGYMIKTVIVHN